MDDGRVVADPYGLLLGTSRTAAEGERSISVPIRAGRWALPKGVEGTIARLHAEIDGRACDVMPSVVDVVRGTPVALFATLRPGPVLRVVDAASGFALTRAVLLPARSGESPLYPERRQADWPPDIYTPVPIQLPSGTGTDVFWVGCEGYAWSLVAIPYADTKDRCVALERESQADVLLAGLPAGAACRLRFYRALGHDPLQVVEEAQVVIDRFVEADTADPLVSLAVPRGNWIARVEKAGTGRTFVSEPIVCSLTPGESSTFVLDCQEEVPAARSRMSLRLLVDAGHPLVENCTLVPAMGMRSEGATRRHVAVTDDRRAFEQREPRVVDVQFQDVQSGTYTLVVQPTQWTHVIVHGEGANAQASVPVVPPRTVPLVLAGVGSDSASEVESVLWSASTTGLFEPALAQGQGRFVLETALERIDVLIKLRDRAPMERSIALDPSSAEFRVDLGPVPTIRLCLVHQGSIVPMPRWWWAQVVFVDSAGIPIRAVCATTSRGPTNFATQAIFSLDRPAQATLRLPPLLEFSVDLPPILDITSGSERSVELGLKSPACDR